MNTGMGGIPCDEDTVAPNNEFSKPIVDRSVNDKVFLIPTVMTAESEYKTIINFADVCPLHGV